MSNLYPPVPPKDEDALTSPRRDEELPPGLHVPRVGENTQAGAVGSRGGMSSNAKDETAQLGEQAAESGRKVAGVVKEEAAEVVSEVRVQVGDLLSEAKEQLNEQASSQQERVAAGLHAVSVELRHMADNSDEGGMASDLVRQAAGKTGSVASWLSDRDPGSLLAEVRQFAREKPGSFIAIAAAAGVLAGRLTRSVASEGAASHASSAAKKPSTGAVSPTGVSPVSTTRSQTGTRDLPASSINLDPDIQAGSATPIFDTASQDPRYLVQPPEGGDRR